MPELRENWFFHQYLSGILNLIGQLPVIGLYADPTNEESVTTNRPIKLDMGHYFMTRGGNGSARGPLCPPSDIVPSIKLSNEFDFSGMIWKGVVYDPRHVILDLNCVWLKVRLQYLQPEYIYSLYSLGSRITAHFTSSYEEGQMGSHHQSE